MLPKDPIVLLSFVNMKLRDTYASLDQMAEDMDFDKNEVIEKLKAINYVYDEKQNCFV